MWSILLMLFAPCVAGLVAAILIRVLWLRDVPRLSRAVTVVTVLAGALPVLALLLMRAYAWLTPVALVRDGYERERLSAMLPLLSGVVAVLLLSLPAPRRARPMSADLAPRSVRTFLQGRWVAGVVVGSALTVGLTVAMGIPSRRDESGRFTQRWVDIGTAGVRSGFGTYGWYYSVPALIALALLLAVAALAWWSIPRPAWDAWPEQDAARRRLRAENIGRVVLGAVIVHLGFVLRHLAGEATTFSQIGTQQAGTVTIPSPLAAMEPVFAWASLLAEALGLALWLIAAFTAIPSPLGRHTLSPAPAR